MSIDIAGVAALLLALITIYKTFSNRKVDTARSQIDLISSLQELARKNVEQNQVLSSELTDTLSRNRKLQQNNEIYKSILCSWYAGISLLCQQLKANNMGIPCWRPDASRVQDVLDEGD